MSTVLFVNHPHKNCGVYQFGQRTATVLCSSSSFSIHYVECRDAEEVADATDEVKPDIVYYNFHPAATPWMNRRIERSWKSFKSISSVHDDVCGEFDAYIFYGPYDNAPPNLYECGRCCPEVDIALPSDDEIRIATFGFAHSAKRFEHLATLVAQSFEKAEFSIHIPPNLFVDPSGEGGRKESERMRNIVHTLNPNIKVKCSFEFLSEGELLSFLGQHDLLVFDYQSSNRGISSVIDYALMLRRPFAVNRTSMFRHLFSVSPSICHDDRSLSDILQSGIGPLQPLYEAYSPQQFIRRHEEIFRTLL
jgi:glycosyltransferase involved in cell wall biosynthesis